MLARLSAVLAVILCSASIPVPAHGTEVLHPKGVYQEPATGMSYPEAIGDFARVNVIKYAPDGTDESVGYSDETPSSEIVMTVYFFRSPPLHSFGSPQSVINSARAHLCDEQFRGVENEVMAAHPDARLLGEETISLDQLGTSFSGRKADYEMTISDFFGRSQTTHSEAHLLCYAGGEWSVEYRIDYPVGYDASAKISAFMRDFQWSIKSAP